MISSFFCTFEWKNKPYGSDKWNISKRVHKA